jgi:hypothetical protein
MAGAHNSEWIAAAHEAMPAMLAELRASREFIDAIEAEIADKTGELTGRRAWEARAEYMAVRGGGC